MPVIPSFDELNQQLAILNLFALPVIDEMAEIIGTDDPLAAARERHLPTSIRRLSGILRGSAGELVDSLDRIADEIEAEIT